MGRYDFDKVTVRRGTGCVKWDESAVDDIIPMWVADMDFEVAPAIQDAIGRRAQHPVFGYTHVGDKYYDAIISWFSRRHGWHDIRREDIIYTTGVVPAISACLKAMTMAGEKVLVLTPVYNCFFSSIRNSGCEVLGSGLRTDNRRCSHEEMRWEVDWDDFERKCADEKTTVFLLCNPHNPVGRVWTREELERMKDICCRHGVQVISDEIHCELVMPGYQYQPFATVGCGQMKNIPSVVLTSPSKAFNIAGLQTANIICKDTELRRRIDRAININEVCDLNVFGPEALVAAYNESEEWLDELCQYLYGNYEALREFFAEQLPQLPISCLEGTYLVWVDVSAVLNSKGNITNSDALTERLLNDGHVQVSSGSIYGGEGYIRLNIATQRERMMEGLRRIKKVIDGARIEE